MTAVEAVRMDASNNSVYLIFAISCVMYITYYNSRVAGYIITRIVNRLFIRDGFFKIGSFTVNVLSGKIMFRDVVYITHDTVSVYKMAT
ncbi:tweek [Carabus blaptoides fortunei]